jgi:Beta-propeller repeat
MKRFYVNLLLVGFLVTTVAGCFRQPPSAPPTNPEGALFSDTDVDKARLSPARHRQELSPQDLGEVAGGSELKPLQNREAGDGLESTAVLPGVEGFIYFIEHDPSLVNPWRVFRFDQAADTRTAIYSGKREIQAVGGSGDGRIILLSMRQTVAGTSDFEIFRFQVTPKVVQQLTDNAVDDTNVSLSASGLVAAWQSPDGGTLTLYRYPDVTSPTGTLVSLSNASAQVQPSLSGNGNFLVFIRELADGKDRLIRYDVAANAYLTILTTTLSLEHPSVSDDGNKILWLQHNATGDSARLKNVAAATVQTVITNTANGIEHPFLTGDGLYLTYGLQRNGVWTVYTKNLSTATATQGTNPVSPKNQRGMVWVLPPTPVTLAPTWLKQFGTSFNEFTYGHAADSRGNVYIFGSTSGAFPNNTNLGFGDAFIAKYDSAGTQLWVKQFGTSGRDYAYGITTDISGSVYVSGFTSGAFPNSINLGSNDTFVAKYDSSGTQLWVKQFGTSGYDDAGSITTDISGSVYVSGSTNGTFPNNTNSGFVDAFIARYDGSGTQLWLKQFGASGHDYAGSITTDSRGNVYISGFTNGAFPSNTSSGPNDAFIARYDSAGTQSWVKQFGTRGDDFGGAIAADGRGNVYISGTTDGAFPNNTNSGFVDAFIARYDSAGTQSWVKQFGTSDLDAPSGITTDISGSVYVSGFTTGAFPNNINLGFSDIFIAKFLAD